eukprot:g4122.t1
MRRTNHCQNVSLLVVALCLIANRITFVHGGAIRPDKVKRTFVPPNLIKEKLRDGDYNADGGLFESYNEGVCAQQFGQTGVCSKPCLTKWPKDQERCIVEDKDGNCICVDPCVVNTIPIYGEWGNEVRGSGCETCVRHKTFKSLLKQPETISNSPMNCGWCGNSCVSGDRNGPTILGNECPDDYRYTIFQCRQQELTNEELNGIKIDEPYGVGADKVESQGNAATKEESPSQVIAKAKGGSVSKKVR